MNFDEKQICEMSEKVIEALTEKYEAIRKEVTEVMGGKVLNYPAKEILMRGREEGRQEGWQEGREEGRQKMLLELVRKNLLQIKDAAEQIGMTEEEFRQCMEKWQLG